MAKVKIMRCIDRENALEGEIVPTKAGASKTMASRNEQSTETIEISGSATHKNCERLCRVYDQLINAMEGRAQLKITVDQAMRVLKISFSKYPSSCFELELV